MRRYYTSTMYIHYQPPLFHLLRGTYPSAPPHNLLFTASCLTGSQDLSSATWPRLCCLPSTPPTHSRHPVPHQVAFDVKMKRPAHLGVCPTLQAPLPRHQSLQSSH